MYPLSLSWPQVNAWRLRQHALAPRLEREEFLGVASRTCGLQAQVMSAAEQALGIRVEGTTPKDVQDALWDERSLVKTWAMRATLHLLAAKDLPLYVAARSLDEPLNWDYYFSYYGIDKPQLEAYPKAAPEILADRPMTREALARAISEHIGVPALYDLMVSKGWGTPLKPLAWRGTLCFGSNDGRNMTFVNPRHRLGARITVDPNEALQEIARRYLSAFGPATVEQFAQWWGMRLTPARALFRSLEAELEAVEIEGFPALTLRESIEPIKAAVPGGAVHLLPLFDAYLMGIGRGADIEALLPTQHYRLVYRPQGWSSAVVLEDGFVRGVWEAKTRRSQTAIALRMFSPPTAALRRGIEAEAQRLAAFWETDVSLAYQDE
jgi:hypothetical protein